MTREETIKILAILKAAYPNSYKNMSKEEANATATVWAVQFADVPVDLVMIAINKIISNSPFPPAISEVKEKINALYWEVWDILNFNRNIKTLTDEQESKYQKLFDIIGSIRTNHNTEPTIRELVEGGNSIGVKLLQGD
jgi:hypothetical protein